MANEDDDVAVEETEAAGGGKKKLIIIGAAALVLLLAIGGGAYWFLFMGDDNAATDEGTEVVLDADGNPVEGEDMNEDGFFASGPGKAMYHQLKPKFVTTFEANSRQRYVQVEVTLVTRDEDVLPALKMHQPLIRNALVMLLAEQDYLALQTTKGKAELRVSATEVVREILQKEIDKPGVERVLFTDFVMQ